MCQELIYTREGFIHTRLVKKPKRTIFLEFTGQPLPAPCLAISRPMAHTHRQ